MTNSHKTIYVFRQPNGMPGDEGITVIEPQSWDDNIEAMKLFEEYNCVPCQLSNHIHFIKGIPKVKLHDFLQSLSDSFEDNLYFAMRRNGNIWVIEKTGFKDLLSCTSNE